MANQTINAIEDAIIARIIANISYLNTYNVLPMPVNLDFAQIMNQPRPDPPVAFIGYNGFTRLPEADERFSDGLVWREEYAWVIFIVARSFRSEAKQMRGDNVIPGGYQMMSDMTSALMGEVPIADMQPIEVFNGELVIKSANSVVYQITIFTAQDRSKALDQEGGV